MKKILLIIALALVALGLSSCASNIPSTKKGTRQPPRSRYTVDFTQKGPGQFGVSLAVSGLSPRTPFFAFAPVGPFAQVNFAALLSDLRALDPNGVAIPMRQVAANRWQIRYPERVARIEYRIAKTWDARVGEFPIWEMVGSNITSRYAFLNGQAVLGYIEGLEGLPASLDVVLPEGWDIGTGLIWDDRWGYLARNFVDLVNSPILAGRIRYEGLRVAGSDVHLYLFSRDDRVVPTEVLGSVEKALTGIAAFMGELPLETYTLLMVLDDRNAGGVEYHNSGAFVFEDGDWPKIRRRIQDVIAHEYFHLFIPFAIRSDAISLESFFMNRPTAHLWFVEGVTEWASDITQLRSGAKSIEDYLLKDVRQKLFEMDFNRSEQSLQQISLNRQRSESDYLNVYSRGALVSALLDIYLLDLTRGLRGLQEVLRDLYLDFGPEKPLPEERFFEILTDYCDPEAQGFIRRYIVGNQPLPVREIMEKIGVRYVESEAAPQAESDLGLALNTGEGGVEVMWSDPRIAESGIRPGDRLVSFQGEALANTDAAIDDLHRRVAGWPVGSEFSLMLSRAGRLFEVRGKTLQRHFRHLFFGQEVLSPRQQAVRQAWAGKKTP